MYGFKKSQIVFYYKFDPFPPSQGIDPDFKFMENLRVRLGWAHLEKVAGINWIQSSLAGDSPPEHFEPNWRSVGACAILRQASKVLAS